VIPASAKNRALLELFPVPAAPHIKIAFLFFPALLTLFVIVRNSSTLPLLPHEDIDPEEQDDDEEESINNSLENRGTLFSCKLQTGFLPYDNIGDMRKHSPRTCIHLA
jgi:hypothetical protein